MTWTTHRRETGLIEHVCEHGVGHPSLGSALWMAEVSISNPETSLEDNFQSWCVHGCDGCCGQGDFPGTWYESTRWAHRIIRDLKENLFSTEAELAELKATLTKGTEE